MKEHWTQALVALLPVLTNCAAPLGRPPAAPVAGSQASVVDCPGIDRDHRTWGAVAKFAGVIAGSGGLATVPIPDEQKTLRWSVGIGAVVLGGLAAASVFVAEDAASTFAKECVK